MKYLLTILLALGFLAGCKKESYVAVFDEVPQQRMQDKIDSVRTILTGAQNGWIGVLPTGTGGGFGFYMTFDNQEVVNMYADLTNTTASTVKSSRYRIHQDAGVALTFDTYTYISILNNPDPSAFGGTLKDGFKSDVDFIYQRATADSIIFVGKRYRQPFSLVKATAEQKTRYTNGDYLTAINNFKNAFTGNYPYLEYKDVKIAVEPSLGTTLATGKRVSLNAIYGDSIASVSGKYAFTIDNMNFLNGGVKMDDLTFTRLGWKDATTLSIFDNTGKEYVLKNNSIPLIPLVKLLGVKYKLQAKLKTIPPGNSTIGAAIIGQYVNNLDNRYSGYVFNDGTLTLQFDIVNKRLSVLGWHNQNGNSGWTTTIVFDYTVDGNDDYSFKLRTAASGGYVEKLMNEAGKQTIQKFLLENKVRFDYYSSGGVAYGRMTSVNNPSIVVVMDLAQ